MLRQEAGSCCNDSLPRVPDKTIFAQKFWFEVLDHEAETAFASCSCYNIEMNQQYPLSLHQLVYCPWKMCPLCTHEGACPCFVTLQHALSVSTSTLKLCPLINCGWIFLCTKSGTLFYSFADNPRMPRGCGMSSAPVSHGLTFIHVTPWPHFRETISPSSQVPNGDVFEACCGRSVRWILIFNVSRGRRA